MDSVEVRLARLERSARRWRLACLGLALCVSARLWLGAAQAPATFDTIRAHRVVMVDEDGAPRGGLGADANGGYLDLSAADGRNFFTASAITAKDGMIYGAASIRNTRTGKVVALLSDTEDGGAALVYRPDGSEAGHLVADAAGGTLVVYGRRTKAKIIVHVSDESASIGAMGYNGKTQWAAPIP